MSQYRRNNWQDQPTIVEVWSEKSTVEGVLQPVLDELGVTFRVMKGFGSFTTVMQAAEDTNELCVEPEDDRRPYIGDWDPTGLYMSNGDLPTRLERYGGKWRLKRIAIVKADTPHLPHFDVATKSADPRHRWFVERYGRRCWELDAMDPNDLRDRVRKEIERTSTALVEPRHRDRGSRVASMTDFQGLAEPAGQPAVSKFGPVAICAAARPPSWWLPRCRNRR